MKKFIGLILLSALLLPAFGQEAPKKSKVVAYYFHGDFRCPTCYKLEQYSKEVIDTYFKDVLSSGKLEFKAVNIDEKANRHFVNNYQLYTKSLILSLVKDGKEIKYKNLTKIWEYVGDRQGFFEYVRSEVQDFLRDT